MSYFKVVSSHSYNNKQSSNRIAYITEFNIHLDNHKIVTNASSLRFSMHAGKEAPRMDDREIIWDSKEKYYVIL
jgi:hypothetical protein